MSELSWSETKRQVRERARHCCEYCQTSEENNGQTHHVDHINPKGGNGLDNLCLACWNCNTSKLDVTEAIDLETNQTVSLFNPRQQIWLEHFEWIEGYTQLRGLTSTGRATIERLKMNRPQIVTARQRWVLSGFHPPKSEE